MSFDRLRYEIKLMGKRFFLTPILLMLGVTLLALLLSYMGTDPARFLIGTPEMLLPLAAGFVASTILTQDPALELHLTMPRKYRLTSTLRQFLIFLWIGIVTLVTINVLTLAGMLNPPSFVFTWSPLVQWLTLQLLWLAPMLFLMGIGICFALLTQSRTGSYTVQSGIWLISILYKDAIAITPWLRPLLLFPTTSLTWPITDTTPDKFNTYWLTTRFEVLGIALVLLLASWLLLHSPEGMLKGATTE